MKQYIISDPKNRGKVIDGNIRPPLPSAIEPNDFWNKDYLAKTLVEIKEPKKQGLSRNHRISDHDIKENIIDDINTAFSIDRIQYLFNMFPWAEGHPDKDAAKWLLSQLKDTNTPDPVKIANDLYSLLSVHVGNISYGNASQNSAISKHLDLNAPLSSMGEHSLTPRSRTILMEHHKTPEKVLLSPPKGPAKSAMAGGTGILLSSQYGLGGTAHKEAKNIYIRNTSPKTRLLLGIFNPQPNQASNPALQPSPPPISPVKDSTAEFCTWIDSLFFARSSKITPSKSAHSRYDWIEQYF